MFWDIDGTLIRSNRAGLYALEQAVGELYGQTRGFEHIPTAGMTDTSIAAAMIADLTGQPAVLTAVTALTKRYEQLLVGQLEQHGGQVLPGVMELLTYVNKQPNWHSLLLTGNSECGAMIKLQHFGLAKYFDFNNSAFCCDYLQRDEIAADALTTFKLLTAEQLALGLVIGDTPNDIRCGNKIGLYTLAVATGRYSLSELARCNPWRTTAYLPPVSTLTSWLEELAAAIDNHQQDLQ